MSQFRNSQLRMVRLTLSCERYRNVTLVLNETLNSTLLTPTRNNNSGFLAVISQAITKQNFLFFQFILAFHNTLFPPNRFFTIWCRRSSVLTLFVTLRSCALQLAHITMALASEADLYDFLHTVF